MLNIDNIDKLVKNAILNLNKFHDADEVYTILKMIDNDDKNSKLYINNLKNEIYKQLDKTIETSIKEQVHLFLI